MGEKILVSVAMPTYGQEKFIAEAILGVLSQRCDFKVELIVADDCSPDNTEEIVRNIIETHPKGSWIKYTKHPKNKGAIPNFIWALQQATGKYIAICEGDDYWTDPSKLQKQSNFLEENQDYVLCFHKVKVLVKSGELVDDFITRVPENYELRKTLVENSNYIHTPSVFFRNIIVSEYNSPEFHNSPIGDYFLYLILSLHGKIGYIQETMGVYRHGVGIFSSLDHLKHLKASVLLFTNLYAYEKDPSARSIFYNHLQYALSEIEGQYRKNDKLLETKRHKILEKIYNKFKNK
jgi:glycosyltransferase involved in cell wall biosynthesis